MACLCSRASCLACSPHSISTGLGYASGGPRSSELCFQDLPGHLNFSVFLLFSHNRYEFDVQPRFGVAKVLTLKMRIGVAVRYSWDRWRDHFRKKYCLVFLTSYSCICSPTETNSQHRLIAKALKIRRRTIIAITFIAAPWATGVVSVIAFCLIRN